jgi:hypothetical protein
LQAEYGDEEYHEGNSAYETDPQCHFTLPGSRLDRAPMGGIEAFGATNLYSPWEREAKVISVTAV